MVTRQKVRIILKSFDHKMLDTSTEQRIMGSLRQIANQRTTLYIAHRLSTVVHCDRIFVLDVRAAWHQALVVYGCIGTWILRCTWCFCW